jgi:bacillithiol biosynthesis deacetylase BshB1
MKLDVLVLTAHPDDAEFAMGGTILKLLAEGKKVGIADFTRGELGTHGSPELREKEAAEADKRIGLTLRINLGFRDGFFLHDEPHVLDVIKVLRRFQPDIIFGNPSDDRHPDHGRAHNIIRDAAFLSGLSKIQTQNETGKEQDTWRPKRHFHYIQSYQHEPHFIVDVSDFWQKKVHALKAYDSQFFREESKGKEVVVSQSDFPTYLEARGRAIGSRVGVLYGEGFLSPHQPIKIEDVASLL